MPPPPYEYSQKPHSPEYSSFIIPPAHPQQDSAVPGPPYPGLDVELPKYCEVVVTTQVRPICQLRCCFLVILSYFQPRRCQRTEQHHARPTAAEYLPYALLIVLAVISILLCFPVGVCALGYSISVSTSNIIRVLEMYSLIHLATTCILLHCFALCFHRSNNDSNCLLNCIYGTT